MAGRISADAARMERSAIFHGEEKRRDSMKKEKPRPEPVEGLHLAAPGCDTVKHKLPRADDASRFSYRNPCHD